MMKMPKAKMSMTEIRKEVDELLQQRITISARMSDLQGMCPHPVDYRKRNASNRLICGICERVFSRGAKAPALPTSIMPANSCATE